MSRVEPRPEAERGPRRVYRNDAIEVNWEPRLCIHTRSCVRRLGEVFDPARQPWIDLDAAGPDEIAETVVSCPTGALHFRRLVCDGSHRQLGFTTAAES